MIYSRRFFAHAVPAAGDSVTVYTVPSGVTVVLRTLTYLGWTAGAKTYVNLSGAGTIMRFLAGAVEDCQTWNGHLVLPAGDVLKLDSNAHEAFLTGSGYYLSP